MIAATLVALSVLTRGSAGAADIGRSDWEPDCAFSKDARSTLEGREALWAGRAGAEPICLFAGAHAWAGIDLPRAEQLYALAIVRRRYDALRCAQSVDSPMAEIVALARIGTESALEAAGLEAVPQEIIRQVAGDPATYRYRTDHLARMCAGAVRPGSSWPALQKRVKREASGR